MEMKSVERRPWGQGGGCQSHDLFTVVREPGAGSNSGRRVFLQRLPHHHRRSNKGADDSAASDGWRQSQPPRRSQARVQEKKRKKIETSPIRWNQQKESNKKAAGGMIKLYRAEDKHVGPLAVQLSAIMAALVMLPYN